MTAFISGKLGVGVLNGTSFTEPSAAEYQRQPVTFSTFPGSVGTNDDACNFGVAASNWGTLTAWALFDGTGNQVMVGTLDTPINGAAGQTITILQDALTISFAAGETPSGSGLLLFAQVVGSGSAQNNGTVLPALTDIITNASGAFVLPSVANGTGITVINQGGGSATLYPPIGAQINAYGLNNPVTISPNASVTLVCSSATQWDV